MAEILCGLDLMVIMTYISVRRAKASTRFGASAAHFEENSNNSLENLHDLAERMHCLGTLTTDNDDSLNPAICANQDIPVVARSIARVAYTDTEELLSQISRAGSIHMLFSEHQSSRRRTRGDVEAISEVKKGSELNYFPARQISNHHALPDDTFAAVRLSACLRSSVSGA